MKKKLIASVLALATCFAFGGALAGCSEGKDGAAGAAGKSAYQIWLDAGNTGSEADFLASLKGSGSAACDHENILKAELLTTEFGQVGHHTAEYNDETEEWEFTPGKVLNVCADCGWSAITEEVLHSIKEHREEATCVEVGYTVSGCAVCGYYTEMEELPLTDHVIDEDRIFPLVEQDYRNLCEEGGLVATICTECNTAFTAELEATGHTWDVSKLVYDAADNVLKGTCTNYCKEAKSIELPEEDEGYIIKLPSCKTGAAQEKVYSIYVNEKGELSTEAAEGYTLVEIKKVSAIAYHTVVVDGKTYVMDKDSSVYPMNGEVNYAAAIKEFSNTAAKCNVENGIGSGYYTCDECGDEISVATKRVHEYNENELTVTSAANCTTAGVATGKCTVCKETQNDVFVAPLGHDLDYTLNDTEDRIIEFCAREACGAQTGSYELVGEPAIVESTCDVKGTITFTAIINTDEVEVTKELPLAPHKVTVDGVDYVMNKNVYPMNGEGNYAAAIKEFSNSAAHCATGNGSGRFTCSVCSAEELVTTSRSHVAKEGAEKTNVVPATCTTPGSYRIDCQNCTVEGGALVIVPATGHDYKYTLSKSDDDFTLAWVCQNEGCDECCEESEGSKAVELRAEGETEGVVYTQVTGSACGRESYDFYEYYNENGAVLATLKLNVIPVPHKVEANGKIYTMDKTVYDINEYTFIKEFNNSKATCGSRTVNGQGRYTCSLCDEEFLVETELSCVFDFDAADEENTTAPGCTQPGSITGECINCGEESSKVLDPVGHKLVGTATADRLGNVTASVSCSVEDCDGNCTNVTVNLPNLFAKDADDKSYYAVKEIIADSCTNNGEDEYTITWEVTADDTTANVTFVIKYVVESDGHIHEDGELDEFFYYYSEVEAEPVEENDEDGKVWLVTYKYIYKHKAFICDDCGNMFETGSVLDEIVEVSRVEKPAEDAEENA